ncbi:MAG: DUF4097 domain-containing protein [Acidobacteriota bacterium]|nr:DUF4097 domain-containing protein [Acidobacteriota bacterium]
MIRTLTIAILLATATAAFADADFERNLTVSGQADLYVSTGSGHIKIFPGSDNQIHVKAHVHAGWSGGRDLDERIRQIVANPPIQQDGNTVRIGETHDRGLFDNISIDYDISAPASVALNLRSGSGDVEVDHVGRFLAASSGSGSVRAHGIHGPADLHTGSGDIELQEDAAGTVKAQTGSGSVRIDGLNGELTARTGSGDVEANGHLTGAARLSSGSGSVRLNLAPDAHFELEASTGSGSIRVHFPNAPHQSDDSRHHLTGSVNGGGPVLEARTGSGDIEINNSYRQ